MKATDWKQSQSPIIKVFKIKFIGTKKAVNSTEHAQLLLLACSGYLCALTSCMMAVSDIQLTLLIHHYPLYILNENLFKRCS